MTHEKEHWQLVCPDCGNTETEPHDIGDECYCGGIFKEEINDPKEVEKEHWQIMTCTVCQQEHQGDDEGLTFCCPKCDQCGFCVDCAEPGEHDGCVKPEWRKDE